MDIQDGKVLIINRKPKFKVPATFKAELFQVCLRHFSRSPRGSEQPAPLHLESLSWSPSSLPLDHLRSRVLPCPTGSFARPMAGPSGDLKLDL